MMIDVELFFFFFQAEDGIRDLTVTGVQTCALPIWDRGSLGDRARRDPDRARRAHARSRPRARAADPARAAHRARAISRGGDVSDRGKPLYMIGVVAQMLNVHPRRSGSTRRRGSSVRAG